MPVTRNVEPSMIPENWNLEREIMFRNWFNAIAQKNGLDPNPDHPLHQYNYRYAFDYGIEPGADGHWPSSLKGSSHPNRYVEGEDTKYGEQLMPWDIQR